MVFKSICSFVIQSFFLLTVFTLAILLIPNLPPYANYQESYKVTPPQPFEKKLSLNERLSSADVWHKGELIGPEAFADHADELYTSLASGDIVKLVGNHITPVVKTGLPCRGSHEERVCGRPLGMKFDKQGSLYVADAYYGIMKVNVHKGTKEVIVSPETKIDGKEPKIFNSLALAENGDIFWSDSSANFHLDDIIFDGLADGSGRLIHYNAKTKQNKVLIDKINFANGVILSKDEREVLVAETFRNRVLRYYLQGPKAGTHDVFIDGLPGATDNLNSDGQGGYLIPLVLAVDQEHPAIFNVLGPFPLIRKFISRIFGLTQMVFEMIDRAYPNDYCTRAIHFIGHGHSANSLLAFHRITILHVSSTGEILDSIHTTKLHGSSASEAYIYKDVLHLGSPYSDKILRIKLTEVGWKHLIPKRTERHVDPSAPKQTTTTAKPTTKQSPPPTPKQTPPPPPTQTPPPPPPPKQTAPPPPPKQTAPPPPPKQTAPPPPPKQTAPPPPPKQTAPPPPPPKQTPPPQQTPPPPPPKQTPPPPPPPQQTTPPKQTPPPAQKPATVPSQNPAPAQKTPPPQQQASPPSQKQPPPPAQHQQKTAPVPQQPTPNAAPPAQKQAPPPVQQQQKTAPPPQQQTPPPVQKQAAPPAPKQAPPPVQQQQKTAPPPQQQAAPPAQKQVPPPVQQQKTAPPPAQKPAQPPVQQQQQAVPVTQQKQTPPPAAAQNQKPTQVPPVKASSPPQAQQAEKTATEQAKTVPVKEPVKTK